MVKAEIERNTLHRCSTERAPMIGEARSSFEYDLQILLTRTVDRLSTEFSMDTYRYNTGALEFRFNGLLASIPVKLLRLCVFDNPINNEISIEHIEVLPEFRHKGLASRVLNDACTAADFRKKTMQLHVTPYTLFELREPGLDYDALKAFYERKGFVLWDSEHDLMTRKPKALLQPCSELAQALPGPASP